MTETIPPIPTTPTTQPARRVRGKRQDDLGRAFAGSQMCLQVWVNRRQADFSRRLLRALGITDSDARVEWKSPLEGRLPTKKAFKEYKDGAFLAQLELDAHRSELANFWPAGGPVWDGLAVVRRSEMPDLFVLIEAKSYPGEVLGSGCVATPNSERKIKCALDETATWLGVARPESWMKALYQSANRIAHVYFLRQKLGLDGVMVNVCFTNDESIGRPTSVEAWESAKRQFRESLELEGVATPWLVDLVLEAPRREELLRD